MAGQSGARAQGGHRPHAVRLSSPLSDLRPHEPVVVVGSGYGGAIMACRLARAGQSVVVLERGPELLPGEFPDNLRNGLRRVQLRSRWGRVGYRTALVDVRYAQGQSVVVGCGLGGTSLINANVALRATQDVFDDERWPQAFHRVGPEVLAPYYERAERMLGSRSYPETWPELPKVEAMAASAAALGKALDTPPINVTFSAGPNAVGVHQEACTLCGDCCSGCNVGAKNTVLANYLPDAHAHGARIFTEIEVQQVRRHGDRWLVDLVPIADGRRWYDAPPLTVSADTVVLAAGTLGSTEILLRSREAGLSLSPALGTRFSGNGDVLGFAYDTDLHVDAVGWGDRTPDSPVGPTIVSSTSLHDVGTDDEVLVEEGAIPGVLGPFVPPAAAVATLARRDLGVGQRLRLAARAMRSAARRTLTYLVMSTDDGDGLLKLGRRGLEVDWRDVGVAPIFASDNAALKRAAEALGGSYLAQPMWTKDRGFSLISVHPLGGCVMADDASTGVVDDRGRVFAGASGPAVHDGLFVLDGSIIPRPIDRNPLLTISAITERAADALAHERGWVQVDDEPAPLAPPDDPPLLPLDGPVIAEPPHRDTPRLSFTERLSGWLALPGRDLTLAPASTGRPEGSGPVEVVVTLATEDVREVLADPASAMTVTGTVHIPALSPEPMAVEQGTFRLLEPVLDEVETWQMTYRMALVTIDGQRFDLEGRKVIRDGPIWEAWPVATTLYVTVRGDGGARVGVGVLRAGFADLARLLVTARVVSDGGLAASARYQAEFHARFLGRLIRAFGGVAGELDLIDNIAGLHQPPLDSGRASRLPEPEVAWAGPDDRWHDVDLIDAARREGLNPGTLVEQGHVPVGEDARVRLTRFAGGTKGPVVLASGFAMAARSFVGRTTPTNLAEHLVEHGYDVWLFDYRASSDLPSRFSQFTLDDVALRDWPAAVAEVRRRTGAESVQAFGHCVGSVTLLMALGAGMEGVRSAVCSQFSLHPRTSVLNRVKCSLRVSEILHELRVRGVAVESRRRWLDVLADVAFQLVPMPARERCGGEMCRFVNGVFGCTHAHAQLDEATHRSLDDAFGYGNTTALTHLASMMRHRLAVDAAGRDRYTRHPERLAIPIHFLVGARNYIFRPAGTDETLRWLRQHNDPDLYSRTYLEDYAHLDGIIGKHAPDEVFPAIVGHLDATNPSVAVEA